MCIYVSFSGTEELAHLEIVAAILHQLTRDLSIEEIQKSGFDKYFVDHTVGVYPIAASGVPFDMKYIGVKGDPITDLHEDMGAEQKARTTYDNLLRLIDDPEVCDPIKFLREREIVHYQRFGEANLPNYTDFAPSLKEKKLIRNSHSSRYQLFLSFVYRCYMTHTTSMDPSSSMYILSISSTATDFFSS